MPSTAVGSDTPRRDHPVAGSDDRAPTDPSTAKGLSDHDTVRRAARRRRLIGGTALTVGALVAVLLLYPVMAAPVNADDRYWYLRAGPLSGGSYPGVVAWTWDGIPTDSLSGRLAPLASLSRRLVGLAVLQLSLATATPIVAWQALVKLLLGVGSVVACVAFVRSLRWRTGDGRLVRAGRRTLVTVGLGTALLAAAGSQAHSQFRNGWTSYPVLTWGAVVVVFGGTALLLWLTRMVAERPRVATVPAVLALLVLAVGLNTSYELNYVTVPVALAAFVLVPVAGLGDRRAALRAKVVTGTAFFGGFAVVFAMVRLYLAGVCERNECYAGVEPALGLGALRTMAYNLVGAAPVAGGNELRADLERVGWADRFPVPVTGWSVLVGVLAAGALLTVWLTATRGPAEASPARREDRRAEAVMLLVAAALAAAAAVGEAVLMGLSGQAQELITQPGLPYRNTMITWLGIAFAVVLAVRAATLLVGRRAGVVAVLALALLVGATSAVVFPRNLAALQANRVDPRLLASETVQWEAVLGDPSPAADARRCAAVSRLREAMGDNPTTDSIVDDAERLSRFAHDMPFCSTPPGEGGDG